MMSTKVITNPISNIPVNQKSHVLGWSQLWQQHLKASIDHKCSPDITRYDTVYIDHGVNFGGTLNLFGGATQELFERINRIAACKNIISLDHDMPDYGAMLKKRIGANTTYEGITEEWCDNLSNRLKDVVSLKQETIPYFEGYDDITLGDSHSISFSGHGHRVFRNDAKTLHGSLKTGLDEMLRGVKPKENVFLCFGSIDIRHHILRHENFNLKEFIGEYVKQGSEIAKKYEVEVFYCAPVPVEFEGRRIPKSGFYKNTPFFGSFKDRRNLTSNFIEELYTQGKNVIHPPFDWYTMDGEKYANTYMEHGSSFHIAPPFYHRNDWGVSPLGA